MRPWLLIALLTLTTSLSAQSGRTFRRDSRMPVTPPASSAVDASAQRTAAPEPQRRLRSGRAWSAWHFSRRPANSSPAAAKPTDASSAPSVRRTTMWGRPVQAR